MGFILSISYVCLIHLSNIHPSVTVSYRFLYPILPSYFSSLTPAKSLIVCIDILQ